MHEASRRELEVPWSVRDDRLARLLDLVRSHADDFARAISADFGQRPAQETRMLEVFPALEAIRHARRHGAGWMKPRRRSPGRWFRGSARVLPQPLGVVGVIAPWNYPLLLAVSPLAGALAAGNRAMVKMSEHAPRTARLLAECVARRFEPEELWVTTGDAQTGAQFAGLGFDHLLFTGSGAVGREVMRAAAARLTPVTLELGGKSPAIVAPGYPLGHAVERILAGKLMNAGQTCIAPDYVLLPAGQEAAFVEAARRVVGRFYPALAGNPDYCSIASDHHFDRLLDLLDDAERFGARAHELSPAAADAQSRRLPPLVLTGVEDGMRVMQEEIFGPVLPLVTYRDLGEALAYVNARPRPLALYLFDRDRRRVQHVLRHTVAGGVTVNDTLLHAGPSELPFGGVGASGMGHYHGEAGFLTFSKSKPVLVASRLSGVSLLNPPYGRLARGLARLLAR
ncbi:coniferyl aldehyde dehydrogenase [Ramlibacter rhizophilus]|uniref:Aldehyde dehydrogenase n=1 Tax=Ramlibacter rhizophilus TaxID=1781167 RepID=A0A4Z0BGQ4_9BURK|nr:coniferyl aldehyde dehydrogenase [Ramlibacter rhizophilus]